MDSEIAKIIAENLIELRKKNNLTQGELAEKLNYSDNAISRWEHAEVTPSVETLEQIAKVFNVPLRALIEKDALKVSAVSDKTRLINKLAVILISVSVVWLLATVIFVMCQIFLGKTFWQIFCWSAPVVTLIMLPFGEYWGGHIYKFVMYSIFTWTLIASFYLQFYKVNELFWTVFIIGIPIQLCLAFWAFLKPKTKKKRIK